MAKEADAHATEDKEQREQIEARNALDSLVYNIEKMLKDSGDKVAAADKTDVEAALADAKKTLEGSPATAELKSAHEKLTHASHKLAEAMYKASAPQGGSRAGDGRRRRSGSRRRAEEGRRRDRRRVRGRGRQEVSTLGAPDPSHLGTWDSTGRKIRGGRSRRPPQRSMAEIAGRILWARVSLCRRRPTSVGEVSCTFKSSARFSLI